MMKIKVTTISRRTNLILFGLLPVILWVMGFYMAITTSDKLGLWGNLFYIPVAVNMIAGWFFKTEEKQTSIFDRIPKKVKYLSFVVLLIFILGVAPLLGLFFMVNFEVMKTPSSPISFSLTDDRATLIFGSLLVICSAVIWVMVLYALDAFRSIRFYAQNYFLTMVGFVAFVALIHRYFMTDDMFFLVMSCISLMLCVGVTCRRHSSCFF